MTNTVSKSSNIPPIQKLITTLYQDQTKNTTTTKPNTAIELRFNNILFGRNGVLTYLFDGFPESIITLKTRLNDEMNELGLAQENSGSSFPKITIAAPKEDYKFTVEDVQKLNTISRCFRLLQTELHKKCKNTFTQKIVFQDLSIVHATDFMLNNLVNHERLEAIPQTLTDTDKQLGINSKISSLVEEFALDAVSDLNKQSCIKLLQEYNQEGLHVRRYEQYADVNRNEHSLVAFVFDDQSTSGEGSNHQTEIEQKLDSGQDNNNGNTGCVLHPTYLAYFFAEYPELYSALLSPDFISQLVEKFLEIHILTNENVFKMELTVMELITKAILPNVYTFFPHSALHLTIRTLNPREH